MSLRWLVWRGFPRCLLEFESSSFVVGKNQPEYIPLDTHELLRELSAARSQYSCDYDSSADDSEYEKGEEP